MRSSRSVNQTVQTRVVVLTNDPGFEDSVRATFSASTKISLDLINGKLSDRENDLDLAGATVLVADFDAGDAAELEALERLMARLGNWPPVVAVTQNFEE